MISITPKQTFCITRRRPWILAALISWSQLTSGWSLLSLPGFSCSHLYCNLVFSRSWLLLLLCCGPSRHPYSVIIIRNITLGSSLPEHSDLPTGHLADIPQASHDEVRQPGFEASLLSSPVLCLLKLLLLCVLVSLSLKWQNSVIELIRCFETWLRCYRKHPKWHFLWMCYVFMKRSCVSSCGAGQVNISFPLLFDLWDSYVFFLSLSKYFYV